MPTCRPVTTRRGFLAALSFGAIGLYGVWEALDSSAAPDAKSPSHGSHGAVRAEPAAHQGHGASADGPSAEEFERLTRDFIARYTRADGSTEPLAPAAAAPTSTDGQEMGHGAGHGVSHGSGHAMAAEPDDEAVGAAPMTDPAAPIDVYLMAYQWAYEPALLRLKAGQPYRFRMMALDASHGASIQLGSGSHIIRLRRGALVERALRFDQPGRYLVYCTVYCGAAHDRMSGTIIVS